MLASCLPIFFLFIFYFCSSCSVLCIWQAQQLPILWRREPIIHINHMWTSPILMPRAIVMCVWAVVGVSFFFVFFFHSLLLLPLNDVKMTVKVLARQIHLFMDTLGLRGAFKVPDEYSAIQIAASIFGMRMYVACMKTHG